LHHPFFLDFFYLSHVGGGFRLHSELFCPWRFGDIVFGLRGAVFVWLPTGKDHCSNDVLSSKADRDKKLNGTNHNEFEVKVKWAGLRSCKQPENVLNK
jgi:hypothetical protein